MIRSSAILFIAIMVFAAAGLALHTIGASYEVTLLHEIATQVELNRIQFKTLQEEFDQLQQQVVFTSTSLRIHYEHFDACSTWGDGRSSDGYVLQKRMT